MAASDAWTTIPAKKGKYGHHNKPLEKKPYQQFRENRNHKKAINIKKLVSERLCSFTGFDDLIIWINNELDKTKEHERAQFLEILISWSLHEIFDNIQILKQLKQVHELDGRKIINWAVWPRYRSHPDELYGSSFARCDEDILATIRVCLNVGSIALDQNEKKESAIGSLLASYAKGLMGESIFESAYNLLTIPDDKMKNKICKHVSNILADNAVQNQRTGPIVRWVIHTMVVDFCKCLIKNLVELTKLARDVSGYYTRVHDSINHIIKLIRNESNNRDFDRYFILNPVTNDELIDSYTKTMYKLCKQIDFIDLKSELTGDSLNYEIIGAIIGEISTDTQCILYARKILDAYPFVVKTLLVHRKIINKSFECPADIINVLLNICKTSKDGSTRFTLETAIMKISNGIMPEETQIIPASVIPQSNTFLTKISYDSLVRLPNGQIIERTKDIYKPDYIDDLVYGLGKLFDRPSDELFEAVIFKAMISLTQQHHIDTFHQILTENNWFDMIKKYASDNHDDLLSRANDDNPAWAARTISPFM